MVTLVFLGVTIVTAATAGRILGRRGDWYAGRSGRGHRRGHHRDGDGGWAPASASAAAEIQSTGTSIARSSTPIRRSTALPIAWSMCSMPMSSRPRSSASSPQTLRPEWVDIYPASSIPPALAATIYARSPLVGVLPGMEVAVPIRSNDRVIGVMALGRRLSGAPYRGLDLQFLCKSCREGRPGLAHGGIGRASGNRPGPS